MECPFCGAKMAEDDQFCAKCGRRPDGKESEENEHEKRQSKLRTILVLIFGILMLLISVVLLTVIILGQKNGLNFHQTATTFVITAQSTPSTENTTLAPTVPTTKKKSKSSSTKISGKKPTTTTKSSADKSSAEEYEPVENEIPIETESETSLPELIVPPTISLPELPTNEDGSLRTEWHPYEPEFSFSNSLDGMD